MRSDVFSAAKSVPITEAMKPYLELHRSGSFYTALCPFHNDAHLGSFVVNPRSNYFKCYACEVEGDGIDFGATCSPTSH